MKKSTRISLAKQTLDIIQAGTYQNLKQEVVDVKMAIAAAVEGSILYLENDFEAALQAAEASPLQAESRIEVANETTLEACERLVAQGEKQLFVLNFASAKNPGGGFLNGAQAQEESLARASALYACQVRFREAFYEAHRQLATCLYDDKMIYSPQVPVFLNEEGALLDHYYKVSFVTAPAVNAGVIRRQEPQHIGLVPAVMRQRIEKMLALACLHQYPVLVLGAWGCGVFQNAPKDIAQYFYEHLVQNPRFARKFQRVVFAIPAAPQKADNFAAFLERFGP